ncbi:hypothetical protein AMAG_11315 [Allomyces macrogynus ATCC 38327]|uniref:Uncharacterized protein n=1 Tax=Allomyces macrogynus (strain ATCC 38327) TaxID=578462 RepID=A0A0L0SWI1_ALLM3|nr:hypothetical protein AMAG_11315 [Allomyces macrogynus ATCC 38327]|eukprot:KNE66831.1 hypothetical protein AMAG_11315 [Allomyces macrogynus ATCC 38327]
MMKTPTNSTTMTKINRTLRSGRALAAITTVIAVLLLASTADASALPRRRSTRSARVAFNTNEQAALDVPPPPLMRAQAPVGTCPLQWAHSSDAKVGYKCRDAGEFQCVQDGVVVTFVSAAEAKQAGCRLQCDHKLEVQEVMEFMVGNLQAHYRGREADFCDPWIAGYNATTPSAAWGPPRRTPDPEPGRTGSYHKDLVLLINADNNTAFLEAKVNAAKGKMVKLYSSELPPIYRQVLREYMELIRDDRAACAVRIVGLFDRFFAETRVPRPERYGQWVESLHHFAGLDFGGWFDDYKQFVEDQKPYNKYRTPLSGSGVSLASMS